MLRAIRKFTDQMLQKVNDAVTEYRRHKAIERELEAALVDHSFLDRATHGRYLKTGEGFIQIIYRGRTLE